MTDMFSHELSTFSSLLCISRFWPLPVLSPPLSQPSTSQWLVHCHLSFRCLQTLVSYGSNFCFPVVPFSSLKKNYKNSLDLILGCNCFRATRFERESLHWVSFPTGLSLSDAESPQLERWPERSLNWLFWLRRCGFVCATKAIEDTESGELSNRRGCYLMWGGAWTHTWNALFSHVGLHYKSYLFLDVCGEHAWWCRRNVHFAVRWLCYWVCSVKCFLIWERSLDC